MRTLVLLLLTAVQAQAAPFAKGGVLGVGAREAGQAGAVVARADEATALWWNPAGLDSRRDYEADLSYGDLLGQGRFDTAFSHRGYVPTAEVGYGVGYRHVGAPVGVVEQEVGAGLAFPFTQDGSLRAGLSLRGLQAQVASVNAGGYGLDLGLRWLAPFGLGPLTLGAAARDLQASLDWPGGPRSDPQQLFQAGAAWAPDDLSSLEFDAEAASDPSYPQRSASGFRLGGERWWDLKAWGLRRLAALRLGYLQSSALSPSSLGGFFTAGLGLQAFGWRLDYAYTQDVSGLGASQRLSLAWAYAPPALAPVPTPAPTPAPTAAPSPLTPAAGGLAPMAGALTPSAQALSPAAGLSMTAAPAVFNPQRGGGSVLFGIAALRGLSGVAGSRMEIAPLGGSPVAGKTLAGLPTSFAWDGRRLGGAWAQPGGYQATLSVWDAAGTTLATVAAPFRLELGTGRLRLSADADTFAPIAQSARPQARLSAGYDGTDGQRWTLTVRREGGARALRVISGRSLPGQLSWNGLDQRRRRAPDGAYTLTLALLTKSGVTVTAQARVEVDTRRPALLLDAVPRLFRPGGDTGSTTFRLGLNGEAGIPARWNLRVETLEGRPLKTFSGAGTSPEVIVWNGVDDGGSPVPGGSLFYADFSLEMESGALARLPRLTLASRPDEPKLPFRVPLGNVHFTAGDEAVGLDEFAALKEAAAAVKKYGSDYAVIVAGHAEAGETGRSGVGELELSLLRAKTVRDYLVTSEGLDPKKVKAAGLGDAEPLPGHGAPGRDRRVEVILYAQ